MRFWGNVHRQGVKVIPIGLTGFVSKKIWDNVMANTKEFYPDNHDLITAIENLGNATISDEDLIKNIMTAINLLQRQV